LSKLRRQIIMLALCLAAVLTAKVYVNRFLALRAAAGPDASDAAAAESSTSAVEVAPTAAGEAQQAGVTVEAPAAAGAAEDATAGSSASGEPLRDGPIAKRPGD
jgi:hypothetical protein